LVRGDCEGTGAGDGLQFGGGAFRRKSGGPSALPSRLRASPSPLRASRVNKAPQSKIYLQYGQSKIRRAAIEVSRRLRCQQNEIADYLSAFQQLIGLGRFQNGECLRYDRFDFAFSQQFEERGPVF